MDSEHPEYEQLEKRVSDLAERLDAVERQLQALVAARAESATTTSVPPPPRPMPHRSRSNVPPSSNVPPPVPDLESRIGAQWLNRIGIIAVLIGVSFFLKYAFEAEWIGAGGRILIGLIGGVGLIAWSEGFRLHHYKVFSFSLKALGLGILYLSLWAALQVYQLIAWQSAFAAMFAVTAFAAGLSLWQNAEVLALFALVGGFATPILLYTGENRALEMFAYITLLDGATLFLGASRAWRRLVLFSLVATSILFLVWYAALYTRDQRGIALAFTTIYFVIFASTPLLRPRSSGSVTESEFVLFTCLLNAIGYFFELYLLVGRTDDAPAALCAVALAGVYFSLAQILRRRVESTVLPNLHLALSTLFLTLAIAIYFESYWISITWFIEAAVLMAIGFGRKSAFVRWQALALIALTIAKVFVLDIWRLDRGYRILSFVLLGMLLLAVSFLYQRDWLTLSLATEKSRER